MRKFLSTSDVLNTFKQHQPLEFAEFYKEFVTLLGSMIDFTKVTSFDEKVHLQAVLNVPRLPDIYRSLLAVIQARLSVVPSISKKQSKPVIPVASTKDSSAVNRTTALSNRRAKRLQPILLGYRTPYPRVCKIHECKVCETLVTSITLTKCNHGGKAHPEEWFPHLPDSVVASAHKGSQVSSPYQGMRNPCVHEVVVEKITPEISVETPTVMDVEEASETNVDVVKPVETGKKKKSKKRKQEVPVAPTGSEVPLITSDERNEVFLKDLVDRCVMAGQSGISILRIVDEVGYSPSKSILDYVKLTALQLPQQRN